MKKNVLTFILLAFTFTLNAGNVVFNNINIDLNCYSPHYVHQSSGEIVILDYAGHYIAVKNLQQGAGSLQIFNLNRSVKEGLVYVGTNGEQDIYHITSNIANFNVHFEIQTSNFIVGRYRTVKELYQMSKYHNTNY